MVGLCDLYSLARGEARRRIASIALKLYVGELVRKGKVREAARILEKALAKGISFDGAREYLEKLRAHLGLEQDYYLLAKELNNVLRKLSASESYSSLVDDALRLERIASRLESKARELGVSGEALRSIEELAKTAKDVARFIGIMAGLEEPLNKAYSMLSEAVEKLSAASGGTFIDAYKAISSARTLLNRAKALLDLVSDKLTPTTFESATARALKYSVLNNVNSARQYISDMLKVLSEASTTYLLAHGLAEILARYGEGENFLANPGYRERVVRALAELLKHARSLVEMLPKLMTSDARSIGSSLYDAVVSWIRGMKEQLAGSDLRWRKVFEEAEAEAGFSVQVPRLASEEAGPEDQLSSFVRNVVEANIVAFRRDGVWKILGALGIVGARILDNVTMILRPKEMRENIEQLVRYSQRAMKRVEREGLPGLAYVAGRLWDMMFGTPERALMTLADIYTDLLLTYALMKLPVPKVVANFAAEAIQGDPIGGALALIDVDLAKIRGRVGLAFKRIGNMVDVAVSDSRLRRLVDFDRLGELAVRRLRKLTRETAERIAEKIGLAAKQARRVSEIREAAREIAREVGAEKLYELRGTVRDILSTLYEAENLGKLSKKILGELKPTKPVEVSMVVEKAGKTILYSKKPPVIIRERVLRGVVSKVVNVDRLLEAIKHTLDSVAQVEASLKALHKLYTELREKLPREYASRVEKLYREAVEKLSSLRVAEAERALREAMGILEEYRARPVELGRVAEKLAGVLEEYGLGKLAKKLREDALKGEEGALARDINEAVKKLAEKASLENLKAIDAVLENLSRLGKEVPELTHLLGNVLSNALTVVKMRLDEVLLAPEYAKKLAEDIRRASGLLSPELRLKIAPYVEAFLRKLEAGNMPLKEVVRFLAKLREYAPYAKSMADLSELQAMARAVENVMSQIATLVHYQKLRGVFSEIASEAEELAEKLGKYGVEAYRAFYDISPAFKAGLLGLVEELKEYNPKLAGELESAANKFIKMLEEGRVDAKTMRELVRALGKASRIPLTKRLAMKIKSLADKLRAVAGKLPKQEASIIENMANELNRIIKESVLVPEGYALVYTDIRRYAHTPIAAPPEIVAEVRDALKSGARFEATYMGRKVIVQRVPEVLPDGTVRVTYMISAEDGKWIRYTYTSRPAKRGLRDMFKGVYVHDVSVAVDFDPELPRKHPWMIGLLDPKRLVRFLEGVDPKLRYIERAVILTDTGFTSIGRLLKLLTPAALYAAIGLSKLMAEKKLPAPTLSWLASLSAEKERILEELKPVLAPPPPVLKDALSAIGLDVLAATWLPKANAYIAVAVPTPMFRPEEYIKDYAVIRLGEQRIPAPVVTVHGVNTIIIPAVDIDIPKLEETIREEEETIPKPKWELAVTEILEQAQLPKLIPPPRKPLLVPPPAKPAPPTPPPVVPPPWKPTPTLPLWIVKKTGKGIQLEKLAI